MTGLKIAMLVHKDLKCNRWFPVFFSNIIDCQGIGIHVHSVSVVHSHWGEDNVHIAHVLRNQYIVFWLYMYLSHTFCHIIVPLVIMVTSGNKRFKIFIPVIIEVRDLINIQSIISNIFSTPKTKMFTMLQWHAAKQTQDHVT